MVSIHEKGLLWREASWKRKSREKGPQGNQVISIFIGEGTSLSLECKGVERLGNVAGQLGK